MNKFNRALLTLGLLGLLLYVLGQRKSPQTMPTVTNLVSGSMTSTNALVDLKKVLPTAKFVLKYATADNFTKVPLYSRSVCLTRYPTAVALIAAEKRAQQKGMNLVFYDCYRPLSVQKKMWAIVPDARYVAPPSEVSNHNRGVAVDVGLAKDGQELDMGTPFDSFAEESHRSARTSKEVQSNRNLLTEIMGPSFTGLESEWWHYDYDLKNARSYPALDTPL